MTLVVSRLYNFDMNLPGVVSCKTSSEDLMFLQHLEFPRLKVHRIHTNNNSGPL